jgi:hypothetical protein
MKEIQVDKISNLSATNEDTNYPVENLSDDSVLMQFKSTTSTSIITFDVLGGLSDIYIFGTNADQITVSITEPLAITWGDSDQWGESDVWANEGTGATVSTTQTRNRKRDSVNIKLDTAIDYNSEISITLTTSIDSIVYAGVARAGFVYTYGGADPEIDLPESRIDNSVDVRTSGLSRYYRKRDIARTFGAEIYMDVAEFYNFMDSYDEYGAVPKAWTLVDLQERDWLVFAFVDGSPVGSHAEGQSKVILSLNLTEAL